MRIIYTTPPPFPLALTPLSVLLLYVRFLHAPIIIKTQIKLMIEKRYKVLKLISRRKLQIKFYRKTYSVKVKFLQEVNGLAHKSLCKRMRMYQPRCCKRLKRRENQTAMLLRDQQRTSLSRSSRRCFCYCWRLRPFYSRTLFWSSKGYLWKNTFGIYICDDI